MDCKNCRTELKPEMKFCHECGEKITHKRINVKNLSHNLLYAFGWDNKFLLTIRSLITHPGEFFKEYIDGNRKKYTNPFAFFAIDAALSLLIFNQFEEEYLRASGEIDQSQIEMIQGLINDESEKIKTDSLHNEVSVNQKEQRKEINRLEFQRKQLEMAQTVQKATLKYFNIVSFFLLPIYALFAFLVYRKPYNYGEHIVIGAYIQGITFLSTIVIFLISLMTNPIIYIYSILITVIYYTYAYAKLYQQSFWQAILRLLKFIGIALAFFIVIVILVVVVSILFNGKP